MKREDYTTPTAKLKNDLESFTGILSDFIASKELTF